LGNATVKRELLALKQAGKPRPMRIALARQRGNAPEKRVYIGSTLAVALRASTQQMGRRHPSCWLFKLYSLAWLHLV